MNVIPIVMNKLTITTKEVPDVALEIHASDQDVAISETEGESSGSRRKDTKEGITARKDHAEVTSTMGSSEIADCNGEKHVERVVQIPQPENVTPDTSQVDAPALTRVNTRDRKTERKPTEAVDTTRVGRKASAATGDERDNIKKSQFRVSPTPPGWQQKWNESRGRWYCVRYETVNG